MFKGNVVASFCWVLVLISTAAEEVTPMKWCSYSSENTGWHRRESEHPLCEPSYWSLQSSYVRDLFA